MRPVARHCAYGLEQFAVEDSALHIQPGEMAPQFFKNFYKKFGDEKPIHSNHLRHRPMCGSRRASTRTVSRDGRTAGDESPVVIWEWTIANDEKKENTLLKRAILKNVQNIAVTACQLSW